jgi:hypothetical protein
MGQGVVLTLGSPLRSYPPLFILPLRISLMHQETMESYQSDWDETFQYLSREMLVPEVLETDLQQQVPTPPVRFCPLPAFTTALTLLWRAPATGIRNLAFSQEGHNNPLCLDHILPRGGPRSATHPRFGLAQLGFRILLHPQLGAPQILEESVHFSHPGIPHLPRVR